MKLTAIIPTYNEEANIAAAIRSVSWADEVVVVDSYSTDRTLALAKEFKVKVLQRTFDTHARQKNWAIGQAAHEWVFILDADERVPEALAREVIQIVQNPGPEAAFWIRRNNYFMGQLVRYSGWQGDRVIRLLRKSLCLYEEKPVHEEIIAQGQVGQLQNRLDHNTYRDLEQYLRKWDHYTWLAAADPRQQATNITLYHLAIKPAVRFLKHYVFKLGFLDGKVGFVISWMSAGSVFMRYLKLWRRQTETERNT